MTPFLSPARSVRGRIAVVAAALSMVLAALPAKSAEAPGPSSLLAKRAELQPRLRASPFGEPMLLTSREGGNRVEGEVYAEIPHPFERVAAALKSGARLCEVMQLHQNVHACRATPGGGGEQLDLVVGPKQNSISEHRMLYALRVDAATPSSLRVTLAAGEGPLSTRDYRLVFEAAAIEGGTFVHMTYSYAYGALAKTAMSLYLATSGRAKVGFTVVGEDAGGQARYVRGERGILERNAMRYYLALVAYTAADGGAREARQRRWYDLTERYPAQLHEFSLDEYLAQKRAARAPGALG